MNLTVNYINDKIGGFTPEIGIILGSGLGDFADNFESIIIPYSQIPGFETSQVQGHKGRLVFCEINGKKVVMMQGRYHFYEGYSMNTVTYPVKVMKKLGVKTLIITNAAGAINSSFTPGDLMFITDHINFTGTNPLIGKNDDSLGTRFPDMSEVYSKKLIEKAEQTAKKLNISYQKGVYAATTGPSYETPAEIKMYSILGANAVGMSTAPEAIVAKYCGMDILGISCLTNYAAGVTNTPLSHQEVIETAARVKENFKTLLLEICTQL
ncbi:MAG: purine-nucleoside phosphorylase [Candidatus Gastranaerophilales bacterium]|nr:purine-nucleoside phosphorylase [Candidatus Gastranaerophilales bacterium]